MDAIDAAIMRSDPVLRRYLTGVRLNRRFQVSVVGGLGCLLIAALLFALFWLATSKEARFDIGSRNLPLAPGSQDLVVGLAFLGDTMVWPFFFLVPLYLLLLRNAIARVAVLLHDSEHLVRQDVLDSAARKMEFETIRRRALMALCYRGPTWRWLWRGALLMGLLVFVFNLIVCVRADAWPNRLVPYDRLWSLLKPYESNKPVIIPDTVMITLKDPAPLIAPCIDQKTACLPPGLAGKLTMDADRRLLTWSGPLTADDRGDLSALWPGTDWQQAVRSLAALKSQGVTGE